MSFDPFAGKPVRLAENREPQFVHEAQVALALHTVTKSMKFSRLLLK